MMFVCMFKLFVCQQNINISGRGRLSSAERFVEKKSKFSNATPMCILYTVYCILTL